MYKCPDLEILFIHATSNTLHNTALTGGDGIINTNKTHVLDDVETLGHESINTSKITAVQHNLIKTLSSVIRTEGDYVAICDSLGALLEYGPLALPRYRTWMSQTEATLMKFYSHAKSYLFRTAFNACGFLMYCDETLVSLGHRISAINDYARVNDPPNECPSADSCSDSGNDSPRTIRDKRDSPEDSDDEIGQNAVASTSNANNEIPSLESETGTENLTPVIEYEDMRNQIELTDENIQGIVSLRMERNAVKGETRKQVLERLIPTVVLDDINKNKNNEGHFEQNKWFNIAYTGHGTPVSYDVVGLNK